MKTRNIFMILMALCLVGHLTAQERFLTKTGHASFFSKAPLENIEAHNDKVMAVIDLESQEVAVNMMIKDFNFKRSLMQEHFNENYMESDKYPKSTFTGKFTSSTAIDMTQDGIYPVDIQGDLLIHGVTKPISSTGTIEVKNNKLIAKTKFKVAIRDHKVKVPRMLIRNIAEIVEVTIDMECSAFEG